VGAVVWILEHRLNDDFRGPPKKTSSRNFVVIKTGLSLSPHFPRVGLILLNLYRIQPMVLMHEINISTLQFSN
jgi:hypothetical protein